MILIVEDHEDTRLALARLLRQEGYEVIAVCDGADAIRYLGENAPPRLVLLDWMMPHIAGGQVLRSIRRDARLAAVPVIVYTAAPTARTEKEAMAAGATSFIPKGTDWEAVSLAVARFMGGERKVIEKP